MKKPQIKFRLIKLERKGYHPVCTLLVNNCIARFVIDTGASHTVMDFNRIEIFADKTSVKSNNELSTGLGTSSMQSMMVRIKSMEIDTIKIHNYKMILLDLSHINATYEAMGIKAIDGVLGTDIMYKYKATLSFATKTIRF